MDTRGIDEIVIGERARKELGDLAALSASIADIGLLHPIVITPDNRLVAGQRRLEACRVLGLTRVRVTVVDTIKTALDALKAERDENVQRQALTMSEAVDIGARLEPLEREAAKARQKEHGGTAPGRNTCENFTQVNEGKSLDKVAAAVGMSRPTYEAAKTVIANGVPELVAAVDAGQVAVSVAAKIAELSKPDQKAIAKRIKNGDKPADAIREVKREEKRAELDDISAQEAKAIEGVFDVIVIDPPWPMQKIDRDITPNQVEFDYPIMTLEQIAALDIPCADDCHVWLWTTQRFLPHAFDILKTWGLTYVCAFVWHKPGGFQPFNLPQYNCEFALYARKGSPQFLDTKDLPLCFNAGRGAHSEKPEEFYAMVRRVTAGRRLDMFNRREIEGFEVYGNESK